MKITPSQQRTYVRPETKFMQLNLQSVLVASGNPSINNPSMPWGVQKRNYPWSDDETVNQ